MKCQNCGTEIGGKLFCPSCNTENSYEGAVPGEFSHDSILGKIVSVLFRPAFLFVILCVGIVIIAQIIH